MMVNASGSKEVTETHHYHFEESNGVILFDLTCTKDNGRKKWFWKNII